VKGHSPGESQLKHIGAQKNIVDQHFLRPIGQKVNYPENQLVIQMKITDKFPSKNIWL